ncbi:MAG: hypothetical protein A2Y25_08025 [Candidatus Melainabacteria bacterium GWF2_37_15]|nr:MAG: hypothetical protein A2Y25_08025 [Candidatus Melainabacteria bacterium GWF2_37_15]
MKEKIFILEDEQDMLDLLSDILSREGFEVQKFYSGINALNEIYKSKPDLILMDLMLPDLSGLQLCKKLRDNPETAHIPIIILTSRTDEYDILNAFNFGCSDYITKPFNEKILIARIKACLMFKSNVEKNEIIKFNEMEINPAQYEVYLKNKLIDFTPLEFRLLYFLASNQGKVFKREQIFQYIYENDSNRSDRAIDILVNRIRKKLKDYGDLVETVYGVGYRFKILEAK